MAFLAFWVQVSVFHACSEGDLMSSFVMAWLVTLSALGSRLETVQIILATFAHLQQQTTTIYKHTGVSEFHTCNIKTEHLH